MSLYVGLDIGGTKILAASANGDAQIIQKIRRPTPTDLQAGLDLLFEMVKRVSAGEHIESIGAAIGGPLDWKRGIVSPLHQPQWREVPLKQIFEERFHCPFYVDVDTNVAALGEYSLSPQKHRRFLYITLSTGMGGGFLIDGQIYRGKNDEHPEIAHQSVHFQCAFPDRIICECGAPDCLEALISGNGIRRIYQKPAEELSEVEWTEVTYNLGQGIRNLATIYLPDVIVLGGGIAHGREERLTRDVSDFLKKMLHIVPVPEVRLSLAGYDTALVGAIWVAMKGSC